MKEIISTVTSEGQITIPAEVRERLGLAAGDKLAFVIGDEGQIEVRPVRYSTVASLRGAVGSLPVPLSWQEVEAIVREERGEHTEPSHDSAA